MTGKLLVRAALYALAALALIVVLSVLWIFLYSLAIEPGRPAAFYETYAMQAVPMIGIVAGIPVLFLLGWRIARGLGRREGLIAAGTLGIAFFVIDMVIQLVLGDVALAALPLGPMAVSYISKLLAALAGGVWATRGTTLETGAGTPT